MYATKRGQDPDPSDIMVNLRIQILVKIIWICHTVYLRQELEDCNNAPKEIVDISYKK